MWGCRVKHSISSVCFLLAIAVNVSASVGSRTEFILPLKLYGAHLVIVQGGLGGFGEQNLLVDTGAYPSAIDVEVARKLHLQVNPGKSRAVGQNIAAGGAIISQVEIGPVVAKGLPVVVEDLSALSRDLGVRVDGLIGLDVLARANFHIDYSEKELAFGDPDRLALAVPIESEAAMALVTMRINGHQIHLLLDTGAATTVLFAQRVPYLSGEKSREQRFTSLSGRFLLAKVKGAEAAIGSIQLDSENVFLVNGENMTAMPFDGIMATWTPQRRRIAFDFQHDVFSWSTDEPPARSAPPATLTAEDKENAPALQGDALFTHRRTTGGSSVMGAGDSQ